MHVAGDIATCMYYTDIDPLTKEQVYIARQLHDRKLQRSLLQFFKPENYFMVREAIIQAGRQDLIGSGCDCQIPAQPPKEAIEARRRRPNDPDNYHRVANPAKGEKPGERGLNKGHRPGRKSAKKRKRNGGDRRIGVLITEPHREILRPRVERGSQRHLRAGGFPLVDQ
jgi:uncharacterized protein DUF3362